MERRKFEDSFKDAFDGAEMNPSDNVWSGIERELEKSEGSFQQAFYGAEINPSDNVWTGIELELEKAEGDKIRRRLRFYKLVAAASVAFALCFAGVGYYVVDKKTAALNEQLAAVSSTTGQTSDVSINATDKIASSNNAEETTSGLSSEEAASNSNGASQQLSSNPSTGDVVGSDLRAEVKPTSDGVASVAKGSSSTAAETMNSNFSSQESLAPGSAFEENSKPAGMDIEAKYAGRELPSFPVAVGAAKSPALVIPKNEVDPGALLLARMAAEEQKYAQLDKKEKHNNSEKLWTSVGFAAGGFSSVNTGVSPSAASNAIAYTNSSVPDKQSKASGTSYSVGVNIGTKLSKRWTIQGGVNYLTQSSDYTATNVVAENNFQTFKAESINELDKLPQLADAYASSKLAPTVPYSVNNNVKFFSVPVQAGYLLVNQKFGLQLNAGVSTDLFLENTITPEGGSLNKTTQGRGDDSPYRSVNFSGLMGTEFSYRFGTHYRIALNPGLRYPLNSVYKNDVGIQSTPLTFDVGLRFKYIFH